MTPQLSIPQRSRHFLQMQGTFLAIPCSRLSAEKGRTLSRLTPSTAIGFQCVISTSFPRSSTICRSFLVHEFEVHRRQQQKPYSQLAKPCLTQPRNCMQLNGKGSRAGCESGMGEVLRWTNTGVGRDGKGWGGMVGGVRGKAALVD